MKFIGLGFVIPSAVLAGYFLGRWLDQLFHTQFLYIVFLILGAVGGLTTMVRNAQGKF